jgi:hypothetical protein
MLSKLTSKEILDVTLAVLVAHHMREQDRLNAILSDFSHQNCWAELWLKFKAISENEETALVYFTQYIQSQLDGGEYNEPLPD